MPDDILQLNKIVLMQRVQIFSFHGVVFISLCFIGLIMGLKTGWIQTGNVELKVFTHGSCLRNSRFVFIMYTYKEHNGEKVST